MDQCISYTCTCTCHSSCTCTCTCTCSKTDIHTEQVADYGYVQFGISVTNADRCVVEVAAAIYTCIFWPAIELVDVPDQWVGANIKDGERTTELNICWNIFNGWRMCVFVCVCVCVCVRAHGQDI